VADPAVFALLFVINVIPIYFLHQEARGALPPEANFWTIVGYLALTRGLELIFWAVLIFLAFARGRLIGLPWLVGLPIIGAALSVILGPSWLWLVSALALAICLGAGLLLRPREAVAGSSAP
jgi:hypothetical protein